ncbi:hypothetical protein [Sulfurimonas sp.]|uniref:TonB-dependent receptor plug domain-containing protein n=1 Tax=Sulfurimonas sp. TaxID=2022749 RepID=UPI0025F8DB17|nr:hypothetical protein [Sulfurimonas sp.]MDD5157765.1 hypothetical protein [Sulfurimonas sp.]
MFFRRFFIIFLYHSVVLSAISFGDDITELLGQYQKEIEGASKTKKESLGHTIVYSGEDLKKMQAFKLGDVLKTLPLLSFEKNVFGANSPVFAGGSQGVGTSMRLYINNHEVSSINSLSPWIMYEQYPLDHISHIEVYWGDGSLSMAGEPSNITIKLYTKSAKHLNGGTLRTSVDSRDSLDIAVVYGLEDKEITLLTMVDGSNTNNPTTHYNGEDIKNDNNRIFAYASLGINDFVLDLGYTKLSKDRFIGFAKDTAPDDGSIKAEDLFVSATKYFDNRSGNINFSIDKNIRDLKESNSEGIMVLPVIDLLNPTTTIPKIYNEQLTLTKYELSVSKEFSLGDNNLFLSSVAKTKDYRVDKREMVSLADTPINTPFSNIKKESVISVMLEDNYYLNDNNMLVLDLKYDKYYRNGDFYDFDEFSTRAGVIATLNKNFGVKAFASSSFTPPSFFEIDYANKDNKNLKPFSKQIYSLEGVYDDVDNRASLYLNHYEIDDAIVPGNMSTQMGFINSDEKMRGESITFDYKRKFSKDNELNFTLYKIKNSTSQYASPTEGATIRASQKYGKFDFYEELIFKNSYVYNKTIDMGTSYNLSLGVQYQCRKNLLFSLKGENLLDDDVNVLYPDFSNMNNIVYKGIQNSDRKGTISMQWIF